MKRRDAIRLSALAAFGAFCLGLNGPAAAADSMVLKSADVHPDGYPTVEAVRWMGEELSKATDGRYSVQIFPAMQLGGEKEMIEQAQVGALAMARVSVGPMGALVPELNVFNLPYMFRDAKHMEAVIDGPIGDEMLQKLSEHETAGLIGLAWMNAGTRNIYNSQRPVASMEDLEGLKIRTMGNPIFVDMMNAMGGNGVAMGYDQLINALQTGVVDGAENNYPSYATGQHYRYARYFSQTEHLMIPEILGFAKRIWETLSAEDQALIKDLARQAQLKQRELWYEMEEKALADMKANGVEVVQIADKKPFQEAMKPVWEKHGAQFADLIERIQATQ